MAGECVSPGNMHKSAACTQGRGAAIMATGLAGGLTEPYKGMGPAAPTRPGLPAHAPIPLEAAQSGPFPPLPQFSSRRRHLMGKGLTVLGIAISFPEPRPERGFALHKNKKPAPCGAGLVCGRLLT